MAIEEQYYVYSPQYEFVGETKNLTAAPVEADIMLKEPNPWQAQEGGRHYADMPIQPFEYSMANGLDPMQHTIIKYVSRFRDKNGVEDLRKAIHTIELLIEWEGRRDGSAKV